MKLTEIYEKGKTELDSKPLNYLLDGVETGFVLKHNREIIDQYVFVPQCIDGTEPVTKTEVLGINLKTPVVMSAMTNPIPAISENGLFQVAEGLKQAGSLMWTGTPIPRG